VSRQLVSSLPIASTTTIDYFVYISYVLPLFWIFIQNSKPFDKTLEQGRNTCQGSLSHPHPQDALNLSTQEFLYHVTYLRLLVLMIFE
jgi:hypothetical protein